MNHTVSSSPYKSHLYESPSCLWAMNGTYTRLLLESGPHSSAKLRYCTLKRASLHSSSRPQPIPWGTLRELRGPHAFRSSGKLMPQFWIALQGSWGPCVALVRIGLGLGLGFGLGLGSGIGLGLGLGLGTMRQWLAKTEQVNSGYKIFELMTRLMWSSNPTKCTQTVIIRYIWYSSLGKVRIEGVERLTSAALESPP